MQCPPALSARGVLCWSAPIGAGVCVSRDVMPGSSWKSICPAISGVAAERSLGLSLLDSCHPLLLDCCCLFPLPALPPVQSPLDMQ